MFGEANENADAAATISDEELNADISIGDDFDPANATPEQVAALAKNAKTLQAQKKHWRGKAIDPTTGKPYSELHAEALTKITTAPKENAGGNQPKAEDRLSRLEQSEEKRTFGYQHNLAPDETDRLFAYANGAGMKPADALKDAFFKNALEAHRNATKNDNATPGPSNRRPVVEGKQWGDLKSTERRKNFGAFLGAVTGKNKN